METGIRVIVGSPIGHELDVLPRPSVARGDGRRRRRPRPRSVIRHGDGSRAISAVASDRSRPLGRAGSSEGPHAASARGRRAASSRIYVRRSSARTSCTEVCARKQSGRRGRMWPSSPTGPPPSDRARIRLAVDEERRRTAWTSPPAASPFGLPIAANFGARRRDRPHPVISRGAPSPPTASRDPGVHFDEVEEATARLSQSRASRRKLRSEESPYRSQPLKVVTSPFKYPTISYASQGYPDQSGAAPIAPARKGPCSCRVPSRRSGRRPKKSSFAFPRGQ